MKFYPLIACIVVSCVCVGQTAHYPTQVPYNSFGTYSKNFVNAFSFTCNQAVLSCSKSMRVGFYGEQKFSLRELSYYSVAISFPAASGAFGFQMNYSGFAEYNETKLGVAYGKKLGELVDIGIQFDYNLFHIGGFGNSNCVNAEAGVLFHPAERIHVGFHVYNPFGGKIGKNIDDRISTIIRFGVGYEASQQVCIHAEIIKKENIPAYVNAGLQYAFAKQFFAGLGIETLSTSPSAFAGLYWQDFRVDIAVRYHLQLGFTPAVVIVFELKKKNQ
jgi:hypothetical protein